MKNSGAAGRPEAVRCLCTISSATGVGNTPPLDAVDVNGIVDCCGLLSILMVYAVEFD